MRILREFRRSAEARARRRPIEGLTQQFLWDRIYWSPPAKFGRFIAQSVRNLWLLRRHIRAFVARVEALERRAAEITAGLRNLQSAQLTDRQNTNTHVRRIQETMETDKRSAATRIDDVDRRFTERLGNLTKSLTHMETRLAQAE